MTFQSRVFAGVPYMFNYLAANLAADGWPSSFAVADFSRRAAGCADGAGVSRPVRRQDPLILRSERNRGDCLRRERCVDGRTGRSERRCRASPFSLRPDDEAAEGSGRIFVRSGSVALGYSEDDEERAFIDGGFLTGDLGYLDSRGQV